MKTVVFIETNFSGLDAIRYCNEAGYRSVLVTDSVERFRKWFPASVLYKLDLADAIVSVDDSNDFEQVRAAIEKQIGQIDALLTFAEIRTAVTAKLCAHLGLRGADPEAIAIAQDKHRFRQVLQERGVDSVKAVRIETVEELRLLGESMTFPCFLKPVQGHSSIGAILCASKSDIESVVARLSTISEDWISTAFVGEEFLSGDLVSVEMLTTPAGEHQLVGISDRDVVHGSVEIGASFPLLNENLREIQSKACSALDAIGYNFGPSHIEIIVTADGPHLVEVNTRVGGSGHSIMLDLASGHSIVGDCIELCLGSLISQRPLYEPHQGVAWKCLVSELEGVIASLPSVESIKHNFPSVREVWLHHEVGDSIDGTHSNYSWILQVMCVGRDQQEAKSNAAQVIDFASQRTAIKQQETA
ncbi:ATP-grasp domain-containing protein [Pseudomonas agarici]|uniref:ATP-grasp domain-containing protein n=1 Tax=Pseudomonas agarici TaxID=46677 RepID=UPI0015A1A2CE|nr:ATP-grasp domain-containing protein [Pseudomonas agarici]NWB90337.1 ATP-grasp domain-containing protein [Pseudomonas agarici]